MCICFNKYVKSALTALFMAGAVFNTAGATTTLLEKDDWKFAFGGFVETDLSMDSTRGFPEVIGNGPVARPNTFDGDNGRMQLSIRNSRFSFGLLTPAQDGWKAKGYLEFDLLGYYPATSNAEYSEAGNMTNPTVRLRHGYFSTEKDGLQILAGQYWTLFGWQPYYVVTAVSVSPFAANSYERTPQFMILKNFGLNDTDKIQAAISLSRPSQRDSNQPNIDVGARWVMGSRRGGFASAAGDVAAEPMSLGVSGTMRKFVQQNAGTTSGTTSFNGSAFAIDALIPIIASDDGKSASGTLTLLGEFTAGTGYSDEFPGWNGGLGGFKNGTSPTLDKGQAGLDVNGTFTLVSQQSWNVQAQYHVGVENPVFITLAYGQLSAFNVATLAGGTYDRPEFYLVNLFRDCTKQIRFGLEYSKTSTHFTDGSTAFNNRYQASGYFRF